MWRGWAKNTHTRCEGLAQDSKSQHGRHFLRMTIACHTIACHTIACHTTGCRTSAPLPRASPTTHRPTTWTRTKPLAAPSGASPLTRLAPPLRRPPRCRRSLTSRFPRHARACCRREQHVKNRLRWRHPLAAIPLSLPSQVCDSAALHVPICISVCMYQCRRFLVSARPSRPACCRVSCRVRVRMPTRRICAGRLVAVLGQPAPEQCSRAAPGTCTR